MFETSHSFVALSCSILHTSMVVKPWNKVAVFPRNSLLTPIRRKVVFLWLVCTWPWLATVLGLEKSWSKREKGMTNQISWFILPHIMKVYARLLWIWSYSYPGQLSRYQQCRWIHNQKQWVPTELIWLDVLANDCLEHHLLQAVAKVVVQVRSTLRNFYASH